MKFEILGPNGEVLNVVESQSGSIRIGKNTNCDVCLDDASVSRVHAVIDKTPNGFRLSDRISASGTFVNQQKVESAHPVIIDSGSILAFGQVSVRVSYDASEIDSEEEGGATVAMEAPSMDDIAAATSANESVAAAAAAAAVAVPAAAAAAPAARQAGAASFGGGSFGVQAQGPTTIIRKKKRPTSFERRFLSNRGKTGSCVLEVALVWRDTVLRIEQFDAKPGSVVTVGTKACNFNLDPRCGVEALPIARCDGKRWEIIFNTNFDGFLLRGNDKKTFSSCSTAEFAVPKSDASLKQGSLSCPVDGETRAKFSFGEASILVHYVDKTAFVAPFMAGFQLSNYGSLVASLLIHFALFSVILFATDRVDALMVDRIMTASRFATVIEQPIEEEEKVEEPDEEEPEEEEPEEETDLAKDAPDTPFAANSNNDSATPGTGMSKGEANAAAQATGLLAQSNAMNSMLAAGMDMQNLDNLDWSSFDASAQASAAGYGLGTTGTGGGGAGLGGFGGGGFGPGGPGGSGAIRAAARGYNANMGSKGEASPKVKMKNPEVSGALDKRIIQKVVRQHQGELRACYEKEVAKIKGLNGTVTVVWVIDPQGTVMKVVLKSSTIKNKNVEQCVTNSIKFWRFPAPKGGGAVQVEYPFDFVVN